MKRRAQWGVGVGAVTFVLMCLLHARVWGMLGDSYMTVTAGRLIDAHGVPHVDTLTVEGRGRMWVDQQWLAHWLFYRAWVAGGFATVALLAASLLAAAFGALAAMLAGDEQGGLPARRVAWLAGVAFASCALFAFSRAQCFAFPLFVALVWVLARDARNARPSWRLALVPLLLVVWANVHGSVLVGVALTIVAAACGLATTLWPRSTPRLDVPGRRRAIAAYATLGLAALTAPLVTPYGTDIVHYYRSVLDNAVIRAHVGEWGAPSPTGITGAVFGLLVALAVMATVRAARRDALPSPFLLAGTALLAAAAATSIRNDSWLAIMVALLVAESTPPQTHARSRFASPRLIGTGAVGALLVGIAVLYTNPATGWNRIASPGMLATIARELHAHPDETVLADGGTASALLWVHPEVAGRVAFDSRLELFPQRRLRMLFAFTEGDLGPRSELRRHYDVFAINGSLKKSRLARRLDNESGATPLFASSSGFVVREPRN